MQNVARHATTVLLVVAGIIHLLPITGVLGAARIAMLYGVTIDDPNLAILMQHRAMLLGLLGLLLIYAAFRPSLRFVALTAGLVSAASFLCLAYVTGGYNDQIARVVAADVVAIGCLVGAGAAHAYCQTAA